MTVARRIVVPHTFHPRPWWVAVGLIVLMDVIIATPAHAASGDLAWHRAFNGTGDGQDTFSALALAPKGGVYVVGTTFAANYDFVAARYTRAGQRRWLRNYDGPGDGLDEAVAAAASPDGALVEAGYVTMTDMSLAMAVIKYDPAGHARWIRTSSLRTGFPDNPLTIAVDRKGNVYVAGTRETTTTSYDVAVIKYAPSGAHRWSRLYVGPGADIPTDVALDGRGNVYVTGYSYQGLTRDYDALSLSYDPRGHRRWVRLWDGGATDTAGAVAVTRGGAVFVAGSTATTTSGQDALLLKYSSHGALRWSRTYTGAGAQTDSYGGVVALGNGDVAVAGASYSSTSALDALVARYSPSGGRRWVELYDDPDKGGDQVWTIARDRTGAIYAAGQTYAPGTSWDSLALSYSGTGVLRWARSYSSAGSATDTARAIALVSGKSVYVAGTQAGANLSDDGVLLRYKP